MSDQATPQTSKTPAQPVAPAAQEAQAAPADKPTQTAKTTQTEHAKHLEQLAQAIVDVTVGLKGAAPDTIGKFPQYADYDAQAARTTLIAKLAEPDFLAQFVQGRDLQAATTEIASIAKILKQEAGTMDVMFKSQGGGPKDVKQVEAMRMQLLTQKGVAAPLTQQLTMIHNIADAAIKQHEAQKTVAAMPDILADEAKAPAQAQPAGAAIPAAPTKMPKELADMVAKIEAAKAAQAAQSQPAAETAQTKPAGDGAAAQPFTGESATAPANPAKAEVKPAPLQPAAQHLAAGAQGPMAHATRPARPGAPGK